LDLTFFGLTQQYRLSIFTQIHEMVFHGQGGYDYNTIYNMPIWLRNFTFNKIKEHYENQNQEQKKSEASWTNKKGIPKPPVAPTGKRASYK
jgi:hypothetical protein